MRENDIAPGAHPEGRRGALRPKPLDQFGDVLDALMSPGQFIVVEPDMAEFVCGDRAQLTGKLAECRRRNVPVTIRWKRADGTVVRRPHPPFGDWERA